MKSLDRRRCSRSCQESSAVDNKGSTQSCNNVDMYEKVRRMGEKIGLRTCREKVNSGAIGISTLELVGIYGMVLDRRKGNEGAFPLSSEASRLCVCHGQSQLPTESLGVSQLQFDGRIRRSGRSDRRGRDGGAKRLSCKRGGTARELVACTLLAGGTHCAEVTACKP